jgi:hypothetical protein
MPFAALLRSQRQMQTRKAQHCTLSEWREVSTPINRSLETL